MLSLDVSDPSRPREVGRLTLPPDEIPHWIALEPSGGRLVITGYRELESRVLLARLDRIIGALRLDDLHDARREPAWGGLRARAVAAWPNGTGPAARGRVQPVEPEI